MKTNPILAGLMALVVAMLTVACQPESTQKTIMNEECLICGEKLEYLNRDTLMECVLCHKQEMSKTRCKAGHYVCNDCHTQGLDSIIRLCMGRPSRNPIEILRMLMGQPFCHMHGPEHHVLVGAALLTAYYNSVKAMPESDSVYQIELEPALLEMIARGEQVPGGACGYWGACGASLSTGMFVAIVTRNTPLSKETWRLSNLMTSKALAQVAAHGGPRCCKRDSYLSVLAAVDFCEEYLHVKLVCQPVVCTHSGMNNQCIGSRCPFKE